ncbi:MAG: tRNA pseudouridine(38-40) synthase TruA [Gammaproteobacteria bacterium]
MGKIALGIQYDGRSFSGWQRQRHANSVQQSLEECLSKIADEQVTVYCAGRTDSGVHALAQVVHFETQKTRPDRAWSMGANSILPRSVSVLWMRRVANDFHARFSATARTYQYIIANQTHRPSLWSGRVTWERRELDASVMNLAAQHWLGEHDFSALRAAACQSNTPYRFIESINVQRHHEYVVIKVCANAFLHHMVRNMAGVLLEIGVGKRDSGWALEVLEGRNRQLAAKTAAPDGLYLAGIRYPSQFNIPQLNCHFPLLSE